MQFDTTISGMPYISGPGRLRDVRGAVAEGYSRSPLPCNMKSIKMYKHPNFPSPIFYHFLVFGLYGFFCLWKMV